MALSDIAESVENSAIGTPRLKPNPLRLLNANEAANVTVPVPWSTLKNGPTEKLPNWSVVTKKQRPSPRSTICAYSTSPVVSNNVSVAIRTGGP